MSEEKQKSVVARATLDDIFISRDEDGAILPVEIVSSMMGRTVFIRPITYGYMKANSLQMDVPAVEWDMPVKIAMIKQSFVDPDMGDLTVEQATNDMDPVTLDHLITLVVMVSVPTFRLRAKDPGHAEAVLREILGTIATASRNMSSTSSDTDTQDQETSMH